MPIRKSVIALPVIQSNPAMVKIVNEWVPIAHAEGWLDPHEFSGLAVVDNSPEIDQMGRGDVGAVDKCPKRDEDLPVMG